MFSPTYLRSPLRACKRLKLSAPSFSISLSNNASPFSTSLARRQATPTEDIDTSPSLTPSKSSEPSEPLASSQEPDVPLEMDDRIATNPVRLPASVQAVYLRPLKRTPQYGLPVCDLQLRSYSVCNLEFFADFALRVAYYLNLPASGPVPLPRIVNRWTVPKANFIFKKAQENFERVTLRRLIQIKDGDLEAVQVWLAYLKRNAYYGVGMKANVWEYEGLGVGSRMDENAKALEQDLDAMFSRFGRRKTAEVEGTLSQLLDKEGYKSFPQQPMTQVSEKGMEKEIGLKEKEKSE